MKLLRRDLGPMEYAECWQLQQRLFDRLLARKVAGIRKEVGTAQVVEARMEAVQEAEAAQEVGLETAEQEAEAGTILFVEHPHVYTLGKSGHAENLLVARPDLEHSGAKFFHIDRGGDITYHGPGQLVCYPILDLELLGIGLRTYIETLEEAVIRTIAHYGIRGGRIAGASGVWITGPSVREQAEQRREVAASRGAGSEEDRGVAPEESWGAGPQEGRGAGRLSAGPQENGRPRKICAIGVRSSRYITMHGFALNVTTDLGRFACINPCGFTDRGVTSIAGETGREVPLTEVADLVVEHLKEILNVKIYKY